MRLKQFYSNNRATIIITCIGILISPLVAILSEYFFSGITPTGLIIIIFSIIIISLLFAIIVNTKKLISRFLINIISYDDLDKKKLYGENQYAIREQHFFIEKQKLAIYFVSNLLPFYIGNIKSKYPRLKNLNIIIDSGTTITPIFPFLMKKGIDLDKKKYTIYTNNLAGINEIRTLNPSQCKLQERHFNLIGGQPLSKYRATTGDSTQKFLDTIWNVQNSDKVNKVEDQREILTLSILTSNWFLVGEDYRTISICARGEGHFEFKQSVINNSDQIILISPLGKILPLDNENELNCLLPDTEEKDYQALKLPTESKDKIFLLTTYRSNAIYSPLMQVSTKLSDLKDPTRHLCPKNYSFTKSSPRFNPEGDRYKIVVTELPHEYIRDNFNEVYRFNL